MLGLSLSLTVCAPLLLGAATLRQLGLGPRSDRLGFLAWSYMAGSLVVATIALGWLLLGKPLPGPALAPLCCALGVGWLWALRRRPVIDAGAGGAATWSPLETWSFRICVGLLLVLWADRVLAASLIPVVGGDEANIWAAKAKVLFDAETLDIRDRLANYVRHPDYPLLNPLLQVWTFAGAGSVVHFGNRVVIQLFGLAFLLAVASSLRQRLRPGLVAALLVLLFAHDVTQREMGTARADLMVTMGLLVAVDAWLRFSIQRIAPWWRLFALALAFTLWSKNEGSMLVLVLGLSVVLARLLGAQKALLPGPLLPRHRVELAWLLVPIAVVVLTRTFNGYYGLTNDLIDPKQAAGVSFLDRIAGLFGDRIGIVSEHFGAHLFDAERTRLLVVVFVLLCLCYPLRLWRSRLLVPWLCVVGGLCGYVLVFIGTHKPLVWHLDTAVPRLCYHVIGPAMVGLAVVLGDAFPALAESRSDRVEVQTPAPPR